MFFIFCIIFKFTIFTTLLKILLNKINLILFYLNIFFKMHWSYFTGQYKILTCKRRGNNNNNYIGISQSLFGQLKTEIYIIILY